MGTDGSVKFSTEEPLTKEQLAVISRGLIYAFGRWVFNDNQKVHISKVDAFMIKHDTYTPEAKHVYTAMDFCGYRYSCDYSSDPSWPIVYAAIRCLQSVEFITNVYYGPDSTYVFDVLTPEQIEKTWKAFIDRMEDDD